MKANNPLYADIAVNEEWLEAAMTNDAELCECLVEQQNDSDEQPNDAIQPIVIPKTVLLMLPPLMLLMRLLWTVLTVMMLS